MNEDQDTIAELLWDTTRSAELLHILLSDEDLRKDGEIAILAEEALIKIRCI